MAELCDLTAHDLADALKRGEASAADAAESCLSRIEAVEDRVKSFVTVTADFRITEPIRLFSGPPPATASSGRIPRRIPFRGRVISVSITLSCAGPHQPQAGQELGPVGGPGCLGSAEVGERAVRLDARDHRGQCLADFKFRKQVFAKPCAIGAGSHWPSTSARPSSSTGSGEPSSSCYERWAARRNPTR